MPDHLVELADLLIKLRRLGDLLGDARQLRAQAIERFQGLLRTAGLDVQGRYFYRKCRIPRM